MIRFISIFLIYTSYLFGFSQEKVQFSFSGEYNCLNCENLRTLGGAGVNFESNYKRMGISIGGGYNFFRFLKNSTPGFEILMKSGYSQIGGEISFDLIQKDAIFVSLGAHYGKLFWDTHYYWTLDSSGDELLLDCNTDCKNQVEDFLLSYNRGFQDGFEQFYGITVKSTFLNTSAFRPYLALNFSLMDAFTYRTQLDVFVYGRIFSFSPRLGLKVNLNSLSKKKED